MKQLSSSMWTVGRRKSAIARVHFFPKGNGKIVINKKDYKDYFPWFVFQNIVISPLKNLEQEGKFDFNITVKGGGKKGQSEAIRLGIARALNKFNPDWHTSLKKYGFLTRDSRVKERKKPGLKRARKAPQWAKR